jgi:outer membrane immunogenic protein
MKFMLSTALLLASGALPGVVYAEPFNGPYVGVQAGLNHDKVGTADTTIGDLAIGPLKGFLSSAASTGDMTSRLRRA